MKILLKLLILSVLYFTSCSDNIHLSIDNPTESSVKVLLDTTQVLVPPKGTIILEIAKGEHLLTLENDSIIKYNFIDSAYMINPSLSEYLISEEYYGPIEFYENFNSKIPKNEVSFLGMSLIGHYDVLTDVINNVIWQYGPREALPNNVDIDEEKSYTSLIKIYDASEFMARFKK